MVKVDKKLCIGCGTCASICSEVFEMGKDKKAQVKKDAKEDSPCVDEAIEMCPAGAISN